MKHYPFYIFLFSQNSYQIAIFLTVSALWKAFQPFVDISLPYSSLCGSSRTICRCLFPEARILLRLQSYRQVSLPLSTTLLPLHQSHPIYKVQTYHLLLRKAGNIRSTLPDLQLLWTHTDHTVLYMLHLWHNLPLFHELCGYLPIPVLRSQHISLWTLFCVIENYSVIFLLHVGFTQEDNI